MEASVLELRVEAETVVAVTAEVGGLHRARVRGLGSEGRVVAKVEEWQQRQHGRGKVQG